MASVPKAELLKLGIAERLELIEELWESIVQDAEAGAELPISDDERTMLDARLREHRAEPQTRPWAEVRAELFKRR